MSVQTLSPAADDFDRWETELTQPLGEPEPPQPRPAFRPSRAAERRAHRELIDRELGIVRHRRTEREV